MATTGTYWETVRKPGKKSTKVPVTNGLSKEQKKLFAENMPRIDPSSPVKESATIYDALQEKERPQPPRVDKSTGNGVTHPKKAGQPHKPKPPAETPTKPTTMEEAVKQIEVGELQSVLSRVQATFPENPSVWLKDLASILNLKMDRVPEEDPVFQGKPNDYPLCMLTNSVKKMLRKTINQCSTQTQQEFVEHCIQSMVADMKQGISTYGYRMFIQLLVCDRPDLVLHALRKYQELMKANQNRALRCLSIMWAVGQAGVKQLDIGLKVWIELMFNTLNVRALSGFSVDYIENLFSVHQNLKPAMNTLSVKEFFNIMDVILTPQPSLPSNLQKRLQAIYPKLQTIAFGAKPENNLKQFFPHFFNRSTSNNKHIKQEALSGLVTCLSVDKSSFSEWRQMYTKSNLQQSSALLQHLFKNWDSVSKMLDKKKLLETIRSFDVTNEDMAAKEDVQKTEEFIICVTTCKELLAKMTRTSFPWRWLVFVVFSIIAGLLAYDIHSHKGYKNSKTNEFLTDSGILFYLEQVLRRCQIYSRKTLVWLQENVPYYYGKVCEFAAPYLKMFWEKLYDLGLYIAEVTKPSRTWLNAKIPLLLEWAQENLPRFWNMTCSYFWILWDYIITYSLLAWHHTVYYLNIANTWLLENVFVGSLSPENILETLSTFLSAIQAYILSFIQWCSALMAGTAQAGDAADPVAAKQQ